MSKKRPQKTTVADLLRTFYDSGFELQKRDEVVLMNQVRKQNVRRRVGTQLKGLLVEDSNLVYVNRSLSLDEQIITAIHEMLHLHSPDLAEEEVEAEAIALFESLSKKDRGELEFLLA